MRAFQLLAFLAGGLAACQNPSTSTTDASESASAPCSLPASFQMSSVHGSGGALVIAPDGRTAWSVLGIGEGTATLDGQDLIVDFSAPAHQFQVRASLDAECQSGEGVMQIVRWPNGETGETPVTLVASRADAYMDFPHLRSEGDGA